MFDAVSHDVFLHSLASDIVYNSFHNFEKPAWSNLLMTAKVYHCFFNIYIFFMSKFWRNSAAWEGEMIRFLSAENCTFNVMVRKLFSKKKLTLPEYFHVLQLRKRTSTKFQHYWNTPLSKLPTLPWNIALLHMPSLRILLQYQFYYFYHQIYKVSFQINSSR